MAKRGLLSADDFLKAALLRYDEAKILFQADHLPGAIYLAGYGVECALKSLILRAIDGGGSGGTAKVTYKGKQGHDFEALRGHYVKHSKRMIPPRISRCFARVKTWSTDLRYETKRPHLREAQEFLDSAREIIAWAQEGLTDGKREAEKKGG